MLDVVLRTPARVAVERRIFQSGETLHAPHLIDVELAQVIRRFVAGGTVDAGLARAALADLAVFPLQRYPHYVFLPRVWELRANVTAYDGVYVALAETLDVPLLTKDRRLAASSGHHARIELV